MKNEKKRIWHMEIILRAMTGTDKDEIIKCLKMLRGNYQSEALFIASRKDILSSSAILT